MATTAQRIERHGIVIPGIAIGQAKKQHLELAVLCAFLMRESGGGHNIFGHDPTIYCGAGTVTKAKYLAYKTLRGHTRMQGVGPLQLTWYAFQDAADKLGGCWIAKHNVAEGAHIIEGHIHASGLWKGAHDYNGSGPAAVAYANAIVAATYTWRAIISGKISAAAMEKAAAAANDEIAQAHSEHADELAVTLTPKVPQAYLPKAYTWAARSIQVASSKRKEIDGFMHAHPYLRVFAGLGAAGHVENSDHRCGYATDIVPLTQDAKGKAALVKAEKDAQAKGVPYTELEWTATNKHLHISWARCPH